MRPDRRDAARKTAESSARMWRVYADELGIPDPLAVPGEPLVRRSPTSRQRERRVPRISKPVGYLLAVTASILIAVIAGAAVRRQLLTMPASPGHRTPMAVSGVAAAASGHVPTDGIVAPPGSAPSLPTSALTADTAGTDVAASAPTIKANSNSAPLCRVKFEFASDRLSDESRAALHALAGAMKANPDWRVIIEGHTDAHGTAEFNNALSERRAQAVKAHLESAGIAASRLRAAGFGASRSIAPNGSPHGLLNRRVDVHRRW